VNVAQIAGLNTMGISLARIDYAPYGLNPPHTHPRGTEILAVLEGSLYVGFVTSNPGNKLFTKVLNKGDITTPKHLNFVGRIYFRRPKSSRRKQLNYFVGLPKPTKLRLFSSAWKQPTK
jgi:hypothetical protein